MNVVSPILIVHSISDRLLTMKLVVQTFVSVSSVKMSPYRAKLLVKYSFVLDFTILYLLPKISIYPTLKFPLFRRFISTYTLVCGILLAPVVTDPGTLLTT